MSILKRTIGLVPKSFHYSLRRAKYSAQIRLGTFRSPEPEYDLIGEFVSRGDWVLDIGANIGHYTSLFSEAVGPMGRVIAFEPIPDTFALLAANSRLFAHRNVTLLNVALSDGSHVASMTTPRWASGIDNLYASRIDGNAVGQCVFCCSVDGLRLPERISLAKIDVEGHELAVLRGMRQLVERDRPVLIVEASSPEIVSWTERMGYCHERLPYSPNMLFRFNEARVGLEPQRSDSVPAW